METKATLNGGWIELTPDLLLTMAEMKAFRVGDQLWLNDGPPNECCRGSQFEIQTINSKPGDYRFGCLGLTGDYAGHDDVGISLDYLKAWKPKNVG